MKIEVSKTIYNQIKNIEKSGANMILRNDVRKSARDFNYSEFLAWLAVHPKEYHEGVLNGFEIIKPGRPPLGKQDSKILHISLPGEVYNQIEQLAAADQRSVVGMTRVLILKGLKHVR